MPSYIAIAATALASIHERLLPIPLLVLSGLIPPFAFVVQYLLLWPFTLAAKAIKSIGILLQVLYLLEGILSGAAGEGLNSFMSSKPSSTIPSMSLPQLQERLTDLSTNVYPASLSTLWGKSLEPMQPTTDPEAPIQLTQKDVDEYNLDGIKLKRDIELGIQESVDLWLEILDYPRVEYLEAVKEEMERIQSGRPTMYLYQDQTDVIGDDLLRKIEAADNEAKAEEEARMDEKFNEFLEQMGMDENARNTLDNPSDPKDATSQTFRQLLRASWEDMYGSSGVMGNVQSEMNALFEGDRRMGSPLEPGEDINEKLSAQDYKPRRIPLMLNHLLRDQVNKAISSRSSNLQTGLARYLEEEDPTDKQILPKLSQKVSDDYLSFFQRAVKIDLKARQLTLKIISYFSRSSPSTPSSDTHSTVSSSPAVLLSSSPRTHSSDLPSFGAFIKKLDWTLTKASERFLSAHEFAKAAFGEEGGYLAVRNLEKEVERLKSSIVKDTSQGRGKVGGEL